MFIKDINIKIKWKCDVGRNKKCYNCDWRYVNDIYYLIFCGVYC